MTLCTQCICVVDVWRPLYHLKKGATVQDVFASDALFHVPYCNNMPKASEALALGRERGADRGQ